jgi:hypothetical protein
VRQANQEGRDGQAGLLRYLALALLGPGVANRCTLVQTEGCSEFWLRDGLLPNSRLLIGCESASNRDGGLAVGMDGWTRETDGQERVCRRRMGEGRRTNQSTASTSEKGLAREGRKGAVSCGCNRASAWKQCGCTGSLRERMDKGGGRCTRAQAIFMRLIASSKRGNARRHERDAQGGASQSEALLITRGHPHLQIQSQSPPVRLQSSAASA